MAANVLSDVSHGSAKNRQGWHCSHYSDPGPSMGLARIGAVDSS